MSRDDGLGYCACGARRFYYAGPGALHVEAVCPRCDGARIAADMPTEAAAALFDQDAKPRPRAECSCGAPLVNFAGLRGCVVCDGLGVWPRVLAELTATERAVLAECATFSRFARTQKPWPGETLLS